MRLPDWLIEKQDRPIGNGKNNFLIRNRKMIEAVLFKFRDKSAIPLKKFFHPLTWLLCLFFCLTGVSFSRSLLLFWLLGLMLLGFVARLPLDNLKGVLKKTVLLLILPVLIYLPTLIWQGFNILFIIRLPSIALLIALYSELTSIDDVLQALKKLHFPNIVLLQLDITVKYIYIFGQILLDILKGIEVRSIGGNLNFQVGSNIWGILYLKALQYGKDLQKAMEARSFTGDYRDTGTRLNYWDYFCLLLVLCLMVIMIIL